MKKTLLFIMLTLIGVNAHAHVPYCAGTEVTGKKDQALQYVVTEFAKQHRCHIGNNCLLNFDTIKYSIAWGGILPCKAGPGSTFICDKGMCYPMGASSPVATY